MLLGVALLKLRFQDFFAFAHVVQQLFGWMDAALRVPVSVLWGVLTQNLFKMFSATSKCQYKCN